MFDPENAERKQAREFTDSQLCVSAEDYEQLLVFYRAVPTQLDTSTAPPVMRRETLFWLAECPGDHVGRRLTSDSRMIPQFQKIPRTPEPC
jgi:hypothetical protein